MGLQVGRAVITQSITASYKFFGCDIDFVGVLVLEGHIKIEIVTKLQKAFPKLFQFRVSTVSELSFSRQDCQKNEV